MTFASFKNVMCFSWHVPRLCQILRIAYQGVQQLFPSVIYNASISSFSSISLLFTVMQCCLWYLQESTATWRHRVTPQSARPTSRRSHWPPTDSTRTSPRSSTSVSEDDDSTTDIRPRSFRAQELDCGVTTTSTACVCTSLCLSPY